ncbi:hypothetical protein AVEN_88127-1 [Araneus ventricosus]|uniref:Uncharacterized protein n=1 Tax=Araneus ventricosus TaxID=182803 RepID=A0A4Y2P8G4_ARAVE|nr:hypothetical protein AVEN_88127-1 [Araneus ventricosus]
MSGGFLVAVGQYLPLYSLETETLYVTSLSSETVRVHTYIMRIQKQYSSNLQRNPGFEEGHDGLVIMCRPLSRSVPGSKPDSTEDPSCIGPVAR